MKHISDSIFVISAAELKIKIKALDNVKYKNDCIRLHRAVSWLKCAEAQSNDVDLKFISLWIAFNACYAQNESIDLNISERRQFSRFISQLVQCDTDKKFFQLLWFKFSGPVRLLIDNQFAYKPFWDANRGEHIDWETLFNQSKNDSRNYLADEKVDKLLEVVLSRLYTVRNQLVHGGATYSSSLNRSQVNDASRILEFLVPIIIDIMLTNISEDWGHINYPVIE
ncbi:conserved hypothetical protein [Formosa agariphila KMM 3901]|uniref:Uncharacterized protein n=1 Tax=Formosa agariphila (strain DSM 15362 / KCTC 12365 / LMG 23005 / KMM 3901 / M-2Alg 35-1) TaxID=1347342 RepID=T2KM85_FORAG|nr:HEPN domain-containing protein [Formosa agariphila]CDF79119.1 conserved hypothetical protein [Formosa agariphila KMM 3901]